MAETEKTGQRTTGKLRSLPGNVETLDTQPDYIKSALHAYVDFKRQVQKSHLWPHDDVLKPNFNVKVTELTWKFEKRSQRSCLSILSSSLSDRPMEPAVGLDALDLARPAVGCDPVLSAGLLVLDTVPSVCSSPPQRGLQGRTIERRILVGKNIGSARLTAGCAGVQLCRGASPCHIFSAPK